MFSVGRGDRSAPWWAWGMEAPGYVLMDSGQGMDWWHHLLLLSVQFLLQSCGADSNQGSWVSSLAGLFSAVLVHQNLLSGRGGEHG